MEFSNTIFIFGFLPIIILIYFLTPSKHKNKVLFFSNIILYSWVEPIFIFLLLFLMALNFLGGIYIHKFKNSKTTKKIIFWSIIVINTSIFLTFKLFSVNLYNISNIFARTLIPFGFSIYILQGLSYIIDLYLQKVKVQSSFIDFGVYMAFFPQLVCGPILRYSDMRIELYQRKENLNKISTGYSIFIKGLSKKIFFADILFEFWYSIKNLDNDYSSILSAWIGIICFVLSVYFYFSAYSDMSRGIGKIFGFELPLNFNYPFVSKSVTEFVRRFNISLVTWYKTYIFTPLGVNFNNKIITCLRLILMWIFIGLWYGNTFNYIVWGLYLGIIILFENIFLLKILKKLPRIIRHLYTILLIIFSFVLFGFTSFNGILNFYSSMFTGNFIDKQLVAISYLKQLLPIIILGAICCTNLINNLLKKVEDTKPHMIKWIRISIDLFLTIACYIYIIAQNSYQYSSMPLFNSI